MKYLTKTICAVLLFSGGCGPLNENNLGKRVAETIGQMTGVGPQPVAAPPSVSPEVANAAPGDVLLVTILARNAVAPLTKVAQNGATTTWISPGKVTLSFENGILVGTRGLGDDLMGADVSGVRAALNAGGGIVERKHSFLTSEDQIVTRDLTCEITNLGADTIQTVAGARSATKLEEDCKGSALIFKNAYWMSGGEIIRSRQVVSVGVGFIESDQL